MRNLLSLVLILCVAACSSGSPTTTTTATSLPGASETTTSVRSPPSANVPTGILGVAVEVTNSVAPYDHWTWVDKQLFQIKLVAGRSRSLDLCLAEQGFTMDTALGAFDRSDPIYMSNSKYQHVEYLLQYGFPRPDTSTSSQTPGPSAAENAAVRECRQGEERSWEPINNLWGSIADQWMDVQAGVDALPEISSLRAQFAACLQAEGIQPQDTVSDDAFLGSVDRLIMSTSSREQADAVRRDYGILYANCGKGLWERRQELWLEQRDDFLRRHESALRQIHEFVFGPLEGGG